MLPPAAKDPFGLASPVKPGMTGKGKEARSPQSISETITHCQEVQSSRNSLGQGNEEAGVVSIQRVEHADGRVSWVVYVPGTTDWTVGDGEPQDLLTNLEGVGGTPTAMESGVVTAMRQAGIKPGEEVALYGHSQGGITVSNIAADPAIQDRYNITTLLTAGSPTAGADIPDDVHALHLENTGDAVPGLDAAATPTGPHRQVAMLDTHQMSTNGYPTPPAPTPRPPRVWRARHPSWPTGTAPSRAPRAPVSRGRAPPSTPSRSSATPTPTGSTRWYHPPGTVPSANPLLRAADP